MRDRKVLDDSICELDKKENEERKRAGGLGKVRKVNELNLDKVIIQVLLFSHSIVSNFLGPHGLEHTRLPCPSPTLGACQ